MPFPSERVKAFDIPRKWDSVLVMDSKITKSPKIALLASGQVGKEIAQFLARSSSPGYVSALYLTGQNPELDDEIRSEVELDDEFIFSGRLPFADGDHLAWVSSQAFDFVICVYWPWILEPKFFDLFAESINFHPALLPVNRGWYPHVHSLLNGSAMGVTLHKISANVDAGDVWAQKAVPLLETDNAGDAYKRLQNQMVKLFTETWDDLSAGAIEAETQNESMANYHSKDEILSLDKLDMSQQVRVSDVIQQLKARTFGNYGFAYFLDSEGQKVFLQLRLGTEPDFTIDQQR